MSPENAVKLYKTSGNAAVVVAFIAITFSIRGSFGGLGVLVTLLALGILLVVETIRRRKIKDFIVQCAYPFEVSQAFNAMGFFFQIKQEALPGVLVKNEQFAKSTSKFLSDLKLHTALGSRKVTKLNLLLVLAIVLIVNLPLYFFVSGAEINFGRFVIGLFSAIILTTQWHKYIEFIDDDRILLEFSEAGLFFMWNLYPWHKINGWAQTPKPNGGSLLVVSYVDNNNSEKRFEINHRSIEASNFQMLLLLAHYKAKSAVKAE